MAITSSAKKALRASKKKRVFNLARKNAVASITKQIRRLVSEKKIDEAKALLPKAYMAIDKATKTHFFKKNTGSRKKSRIAALINRG